MTDDEKKLEIVPGTPTEDEMREARRTARILAGHKLIPAKVCNWKWDDFAPIFWTRYTDDGRKWYTVQEQSVRFCNHCQKRVYLCENLDDLRDKAEMGECVAMTQAFIDSLDRPNFTQDGALPSSPCVALKDEGPKPYHPPATPSDFRMPTFRGRVERT